MEITVKSIDKIEITTRKCRARPESLGNDRNEMKISPLSPSKAVQSVDHFYCYKFIQLHFSGIKFIALFVAKLVLSRSRSLHLSLFDLVIFLSTQWKRESVITYAHKFKSVGKNN